MTTVDPISPTHAARLLIGAARKAAEEMREHGGPSWWADLAPLLERRASAVEVAINAGDLREPERDPVIAAGTEDLPGGHAAHVDVADLMTRQDVHDLLALCASVGYVAGLEHRLEDLERTVRDYVTTPMPDHGHQALEDRVAELELLLNGKLDELAAVIVPLRTFPQTIVDVRADVVDVRTQLLEVLALQHPDGTPTLAGRVDAVERRAEALSAMPIADDIADRFARLEAQLDERGKARAARIDYLERRTANLEALAPVALDDLGYLVERAADGTVAAVHRAGLPPYARAGEVAELRGRLNRHVGEEHSTPVLVEQQHFAELRRPRWWRR